MMLQTTKILNREITVAKGKRNVVTGIINFYLIDEFSHFFTLYVTDNFPTIFVFFFVDRQKNNITDIEI